MLRCLISVALYGVIGNIHIFMYISTGNKYIYGHTQMFLSYYFFFINTLNCPLVGQGEIGSFLQNSPYLFERQNQVLTLQLEEAEWHLSGSCHWLVKFKDIVLGLQPGV